VQTSEHVKEICNIYNLALVKVSGLAKTFKMNLVTIRNNQAVMTLITGLETPQRTQQARALGQGVQLGQVG